MPLPTNWAPENVFMDVDTIDIGVEFKHAIEAAVSSCDVLFVMIGPRWLTAADSRGERRLSRTDDYVRLEVETALGRNIRVVPALVAGAAMPVADDLPGTLSALTLRNAVEMADGPRWQYDVSRLMNLLERIRAGESHAEAAPPIDMAALAGDVPATSASHASAADADTERDAARRKAETIRARVASAHQPAGTGHAGGTPPPPAPAAGSGKAAARAAASRAACRMRRNGSLALAGLGVVAVLALALFGAYQLGNDRSGSSASTQPAGPGTVANSADDQAPVPARTARTSPRTPMPTSPSCGSRFPSRSGAVRASSRTPSTPAAWPRSIATINDPKHGRTLVHLDRFVDFAHLQVIYKLHGPGSVAAHGGAPDPQLKKATGGCNRTLWRGEGPWSHEAGGGVMGPVSGRYSCYQADGQCDLVKKMNADRCQWLDLLRDRVDGPRCHHVREGRAADECARRNRVLLRFLASPVRVRMPASERPATDWLEAVKDAERRGELLTAVDLAEQGLAERPDDLWLKHRAVLALARAGATEEAARRFERYGLQATEEDDIAALGARIAKDIALETTEEGRRAETVRALALYRSIHARTGGYYAAINAATLSLVAGQPEQARLLARAALDALAGNDERSYYAAATEGEAHLLLGDERAARRALERAASLHGGDYSSLATTRRQLRLVCALTGTDPAIIRILAGPGVAHFCGHRIAAAGAPGRFPAEAEQGVADRIDAELTRDTPRYAYGSLASGADIMWAEALLARGAELHIVLPFVARRVHPELRRLVRAVAGSSASTAAWTPPSTSPTRRTTRSCPTMPSSATRASWRWASPCCARATWTRTSVSSPSGTGSPTSGTPAPRSTSPPGAPRAGPSR